jgi:NAD(P)-dependent dehydrogenase (short-subunit alcohol dehydrogenase family)
MSNAMQGKVVLVTGGGSGFGRAFTEDALVTGTPVRVDAGALA